MHTHTHKHADTLPHTVAFESNALQLLSPLCKFFHCLINEGVLLVVVVCFV